MAELVAQPVPLAAVQEALNKDMSFSDITQALYIPPAYKDHFLDENNYSVRPNGEVVLEEIEVFDGHNTITFRIGSQANGKLKIKQYHWVKYLRYVGVREHDTVVMMAPFPNGSRQFTIHFERRSVYIPIPARPFPF